MHVPLVGHAALAEDTPGADRASPRDRADPSLQGFP